MNCEKLASEMSKVDAEELNDEPQDITESNLMLENKTKKIYKPQETNFKQQKLPAWTPMLTPKFVVLLFLVAGLVFIPIGTFLIHSSDAVREYEINYTECTDASDINRNSCQSKLAANLTNKCKCRLAINIKNDTKFDLIHVYYKLEEYNQNHRLYAKSRDDDQLLGRKSNEALSHDCDPYMRDRVTKKNIYPCGSIANSIFNDTFKIYYESDDHLIQLNISKENIAWKSDMLYKFDNTSQNYVSSVKPHNWRSPGGKMNFDPGSQEDKELFNDLVVWMRTAAFPSFRKLYGRILKENNEIFFPNKSRNYFPSGQYWVEIDYRYLVNKFRGEKYFIIGNTSWLGGKCKFLAYSYIIFGVICIITGVTLNILHYFYGQMSYDASLNIHRSSFS